MVVTHKSKDHKERPGVGVGGRGWGGGAHISIDDKQRPGRRGGCGG